MSKENKEYKKLFKNIGLMTISNFGSKILNILLVPLYTSILTTSEYGIFDIYATLSALALPILTCNIVDAVFRFSIDDKKDKEQVFTIGTIYCTRAAVIFSAVIFVVWKFGFFAGIIHYPLLLILYFILHMIYELMIRFIRGLERIFDIAVGGILNTISLVTFNIIFLLVLNMGMRGYFYSIYLAYLVPIIYYIFRTKIWNYFTWKREKYVKKEMLSYSFPLLFDSVAWWINNASDRYIVTWLCGLSVNGIYAVAYKIPSLINTIQNIFNQAWMISAVDEYGKGNYSFLIKSYRAYHFLLLVSCSVLIIFDQMIAKILFAKDFFTAWKYAPFLMIAVVFGGLSAFIEGIFAAAKETRLLAITTVTGACMNVVLNLILVSRYGVIGAAFSTMVSYFAVWFSRMLGLRKKIGITLISPKDMIGFSLIIIQACLLCIWNVNSFILGGITILLLIFNIKEMKALLDKGVGAMMAIWKGSSK